MRPALQLSARHQAQSVASGKIAAKRPAETSTHLRLYKVHRLVKDGGLYRGGLLPQAVASLWNPQKIVFYFKMRQFLLHIDGFIKWHVGVGSSMNQDGGRIASRDIAHRTIGIEPSRLNIRVVRRHFSGPDALLAAI